MVKYFTTDKSKVSDCTTLFPWLGIVGFKVVTLGFIAACEAYLYFVFLQAVFACVTTMLLFCKAFRPQPRLRMVTEAIGAALDDIVHFMVVFMVVFAAFVVAGWVLFGPMLQELRYLTHAMRGDCDGNGMIYGENDVPRFKYTPYICAWIRFTLLQLFVAVLLLNMVIVIRADAFVQGRGETPRRRRRSDVLFLARHLTGISPRID